MPRAILTKNRINTGKTGAGPVIWWFRSFFYVGKYDI